MTEVLIGIQARSTSSRLPGKSLELIDTKTMTEHVILACRSSASHINKTTLKSAISCDLALLIPKGDKLKNFFPEERVVEGDEADVLSRYLRAQEVYNPDFMVRITGDCPLSSPPLITKHIMCAVKNNLDYCSNVYDGCNSFIDGLDVEVVSRKLLTWVGLNAKDKYDKEHVTTLIKKSPPDWAKIGTVIGYIDLANVKLSVDTSEELERVRENRKLILDKVTRAKSLGHLIFRF